MVIDDLIFNSNLGCVEIGESFLYDLRLEGYLTFN